MIVGSALVTAGLLASWVILTVRLVGRSRLHSVLDWPGVKTLAAVRWALHWGLTPTQRRGIAVHAELAVARFHCHRLGVQSRPR